MLIYFISFSTDITDLNNSYLTFVNDTLQFVNIATHLFSNGAYQNSYRSAELIIILHSFIHTIN